MLSKKDLKTCAHLLNDKSKAFYYESNIHSSLADIQLILLETNYLILSYTLYNLETENK